MNEYKQSSQSLNGSAAFFIRGNIKIIEKWENYHFYDNAPFVSYIIRSK
jgi:hypothetical protein